MNNILSSMGKVEKDANKIQEDVVVLLKHLKRIVDFSIKEREKTQKELEKEKELEKKKELEKEKKQKQKMPIREKILGKRPDLPFRPRSLIHQRAEIKKNALKKRREERQLKTVEKRRNIINQARMRANLPPI